MRFIAFQRWSSFCVLAFAALAAGFAQTGGPVDQTDPAGGNLYIATDFSGGVDAAVSNRLVGGLAYGWKGWEVSGELTIADDGQFGQVAADDYLKGYWARITQGGLRWEEGPFAFTAGRFSHRDEIDSPYSLFISSVDHPATILDFRFDDDFFFYQTRWVQLNVRSDFVSTLPAGGEFPWPDRGLQYKAYGFNIGPWKFGYQDAAVYLREDPAFDPDYWLLPLPGFFIQYIDQAGGTPWGRAQNDNAIMGLFLAYDDDTYSGFAQLLVDDINLNRWFAPEDRQIPDKLGYAAGLGWVSPIGRFRLDAAAVTKYTYESVGIGEANQYPYTYYHDVRYGPENRPITLEEMMVGFRYGENCLALRLGWENSFPLVAVSAAAEYVVAGDRSPANPWHDLTDVPYTTEWLNQDVLDKTLAFDLAASTDLAFGAYGRLELTAAIRGGAHWNPSVLRAPAVGDNEDDDWIWSPASGFAPILSLSIGGKYRLDFDRGGLIDR